MHIQRCMYNQNERRGVYMDITERKITKIAREAEKLVLLLLREEGVGTA